jgi:hypothetical protein
MTGGDGMAEWWSIEVFHGDKLPASRWKDAYEDTLAEAAVTNGALYWEWHEYAYGVIFEVCFASDEQWEAFRHLPAVRGALDSVPDPDGLLVYRGRGGAAGGRHPRKPGPAPGAAALELEEPKAERRFVMRAVRALRTELGARDRGRPARDEDDDEEPVTRLTALSALSAGHSVPGGEACRQTVQDGTMTETRVMTEDLRVAIERSGYYPGLVTDAVASALGTEPVTAFFVHHDAIFDPGMEVRRHMTVLALTPTRLVYSHTDEHPADESGGRPRAETSTEAIRFARVSSVSLTRIVQDPASYVPGVTMPAEVMLTIGWNVLSHLELEPAHCGDESCEADHGYLGTITADDLTLRVSEAADGEDAVRQLMTFASALSESTARFAG